MSWSNLSKEVWNNILTQILYISLTKISNALHTILHFLIFPGLLEEKHKYKYQV